MMREFFWQYFTNTGSLDAYLLYKDHEQELQEEQMPLDEEAAAAETDTFH